MTLDQFVANNDGKAVSYDGVKDNIGQCEQLVCCYWRDVYAFLCPPIPAAKDLWTNPTVLASFTQIPVGQEQAGDVAVFGASNAINSPLYGHTDIVLLPGYTGFDSNWGGVMAPSGYPAAHKVKHSYVDVLGFLRFKSNNGVTMPTKQNVQDYIKTYTGADATPQQIAFYTARPWTELATDVCDGLLKQVKEGGGEYEEATVYVKKK